MAFIRAIRKVESGKEKWGLELGIFKEEKIFNSLNDMELPTPTEIPTEKNKVRMKSKLL